MCERKLLGFAGAAAQRSSKQQFDSGSRPAAGVGFAFFIERESYTSITYIVSIRRWWGNLLKHPVFVEGVG